MQTFAFSAAHDLRAPLRSIKSFSEITLEECANLGGEPRSYLERVVRSAAQMEQLLDDLLEYSKLSQTETKLEPIDLSMAVSEALKLEESDIRGRNAAVVVESSMPAVVGHSATVVLIITNFISNALKFVETSVLPRIRIGADEVADDAGQPGAFVRLWVEDNGIGISTDNIKKLFGIFQRLHGKQSYPGTGLGLAIVRKGAERMGGRVGVESELGKGSRFWVELPRANS